MESRLTNNQQLSKIIEVRFNLIYMAAKEKNETMLKDILNASYPLAISREGKMGVNPLSVKIKQFTPISLLAFLGDHESVDFLIYHGADKFEAMIGYTAANDYEHEKKIRDTLKINELSLNDVISIIWAGSSLCVTDYETACKELDATAILDPNDDESVMITKIVKCMGTLSGLAYKGETRGTLAAFVNKYIPFLSNYEDMLLQNYAYGNHELYVEVKTLSFLKLGRIFQGYAMGGNIEKIKDLYKNLSFLQKSYVSSHILYGFYLSGMMHDPEIVVFITSYLEMNSFKNRQKELFIMNKIDTTLLNREIDHHHLLKSTYQINHNQINILFYLENVIWILQGVQLVQQNILNMDLFIKISCHLFNLPVNQTIELYDKVRFKYMKDFIIDDVKKYTDGFINVVNNFVDQFMSVLNKTHKKSHFYYDTALTFLDDCKQTDSLPKLESLIASQYTFFASKKITHKVDDDFTKAIVRHNDRVVGKY